MEVNNIIARLALNGYKAVLLPNEEIEVSRWGIIRIFDLKRVKYEYDRIVKEFALVVYGFSNATIAKLLAGKEVTVPYGIVKLKRNTLVTIYGDGEVKEIDLI